MPENLDEYGIREARRKRDLNLGEAERLLYTTIEVEPGYTPAMLAANASATLALVQDRIVERAEAERG